jgi:glycosyltransferase involved in cell wall biosynthesis
LDFIVFSDDWGVHPSSSQHIFRHIAQEHRVLWINTVGMRTMKFSLGDFRKAARKMAGMFSGRTTSAQEWTERPSLLHVARPVTLPFPNSSLATRLNTASILRSIKRQMHLLAMKDPVVVSTVPNVCDVVGKLHAARKIYYCVDDFSQWPGLAQDAVEKMEDRLIMAVDVVLAASPVLQERLQARHPRVELFSHGVDLDMYREPLPPMPDWLPGSPEPRIGFYGLLDERVDAPLLAAVARGMPEVNFILAGPRTVALPTLETLGNVYMPGNVPYRQLPSYVRGLLALILPYRVDSFTDTLAPLKLKEYILSGLPILASPLAGVSNTSHDLLKVVRTEGDWMQAIRDVISNGRPFRPAGTGSLSVEDGWNHRAARLVQIGAGAPV